jgi:CubicO group peptidase (beta-lactamase class C family)
LYLKVIGGSIVLMLAWAVLVIVSIYLGWFSRPIAEPGDIEGFFRAAKEIVAERNPPVLALALIKNGKVYGDYYSSSVGAVPNADSLFAVASLSKWVTAYGVVAASERGQIDLARPLPEYLRRWHLPPSTFDNNKVTTRLLLSHRAGIHDGLGFGDYLATETLPSLEESLTNPRASSGKPVAIAVTSEPGSGFAYSGGSYHLLELVVEETTGKSFEQYMNDDVFKPLGMTRSTYDYIADLDNGVRSYTTTGQLAPQYRYASSGATALNTSLHDLSQFVRAQIPNSGVSGVLSQKFLESMRQSQTSYAGVSIWGMGDILSSKTDRGNFIYGGDGANDPAINSSVKINPDNGDAIVVLVNGNEGLATALTSQWAYWQTNRPDWITLLLKYKTMLNAILYGWGTIVVLAIALLVVKRRAAKIALA